MYPWHSLLETGFSPASIAILYWCLIADQSAFVISMLASWQVLWQASKLASPLELIINSLKSLYFWLRASRLKKLISLLLKLKTTKKPHGNKTMWCNKLIVLSVSNRSQFQLFFYFLKILIFIIIIFTIKRQFTKV